MRVVPGFGTANVEGFPRPAIEAIESPTLGLPEAPGVVAPRSGVTHAGWLDLADRPRSLVAAVMGALMGLGAWLGSTPAKAVAPKSEPAPRCEVAPDPTGRFQRIARRPLGPEARRLANELLSQRLRPRGDHPYLRLKRDLEQRLDKLGLRWPSPDHLHVSDVDEAHGSAVLRSALGLRPLVNAGTSSLSIANAPAELASRVLRPAQLDRFRAALGEAFEPMPEPPTTQAEVLRLALDELEFSVIQKTLRLALLSEQRAEAGDAARVFVNMSFGQSPDRLAGQLAMAVLMSPPGTELHRWATRTLGERVVQLPPQIDPEEVVSPEGPCEPPNLQRWWGRGNAPPDVEVDLARFERQYARLKRNLAYPALKRAMATPEFKERMALARADFEREILRGRTHGILVFEAAGNEYSDAKDTGDPQMSDTTSSGLRGLIRVGALDLGKVSTPADDRVAVFSAAGPVTISAPGVRIPAWLEDGVLTNTEGTSFASPIAMEWLAAAAALRPQATADELAELLQDPRVSRDLRGTTRDGRGALDPFALVLVAANPNLDRATIHWAWDQLGRRDADLPAIRQRLGLP